MVRISAFSPAPAPVPPSLFASLSRRRPSREDSAISTQDGRSPSACARASPATRRDIAKCHDSCSIASSPPPRPGTRSPSAELPQSASAKTASKWRFPPAPACDFPVAGTSPRCRCKLRAAAAPSLRSSVSAISPRVPQTAIPACLHPRPAPRPQTPNSLSDFRRQTPAYCDPCADRTACNRPCPRGSSAACRPQSCPRRQTAKAPRAARPPEGKAATPLSRSLEPPPSFFSAMNLPETRHAVEARAKPSYRLPLPSPRASDLCKTIESPNLRNTSVDLRFSAARRERNAQPWPGSIARSMRSPLAAQHAAHAQYFIENPLRHFGLALPRQRQIAPIARKNRHHVGFHVESRAFGGYVVGHNQVRVLALQFFPRILSHVVRLRRESHHHAVTLLPCHRRQDIGIRLQTDRQLILRPLDLRSCGLSRTVIRHRRGEHRNRRCCKSRFHGLQHFLRRAHIHPLYALGSFQRRRSADQNRLGSTPCRSFRHGVTHLPRRAVRDESHRI